MKKKLFLALCLVTFLTVATIPVAAQSTLPGWALAEGDIAGWYLHTEGSSGTTDIPLYGLTVSVWWQIWMDSADWASATKAIGISIVDYGSGQLQIGELTFDIGSMMAVAMAFLGLPEVTIAGWDVAYEGSLGGVEMGIGFADGGKMFSFISVDSTAIPTGIWDPTGTFAMPKSPTNSTVNSADVQSLMTGQGAKFASDIPAFTMLVALLGIAGLLAVARRKRQ